MAGRSASAFQENSLAIAVTGTATTALTLDRDVQTATKLGYVAIEPFTTNCEIREVAIVSGATLSSLTALAPPSGTHASGARVMFFQDGSIPASWFDAKGDGSTDDEAALQWGLREAGRYGLWLDGEGRTYSLGQPLLGPANHYLRHITLRPKPLYAPADSWNAMVMNVQGTISSVVSADSTANTITTAANHAIPAASSGYTANIAVVFKGASLPAGLVSGRVYYVIESTRTPTSFGVSATRVTSPTVPTPVDITATGTGTLYGEVFSLSKCYWDDVLLECSPNASTTTTASLDSSSTADITVTNAATFPSRGMIQIGKEAITYDGKTSNTLTGITRHFNDSIADSYPLGAGTTVTLLIRDLNGAALGIQQPSVMRKMRVNNATLGSLVLAGQQASFENLQIACPASRIGTGLALENASFMYFFAINIEKAYKGIHVRTTPSVFSAGGGFRSFFKGLHVEMNDGAATRVAFDIEGSHSGLTFEDVNISQNVNGAKTWWIHTATPGGGLSSYTIRNAFWTSSSSNRPTGLQDDDRVITWNSWDDLRFSLVSFDAPIKPSSSPDLQRIVVVGPNGRYMKYGATTPSAPTLALRPASDQTADQTVWLDKAVAGNRHFAINKDGRPVIKAVVTGSSEAPLDGDLAASEVIMWFDATDADPLVRFKAKNAAGAVFPSGPIPADFVVRRKLFASKNWDPPSLAPGASTSALGNVTVTGARPGDIVGVSLTTLTQTGMILTGVITANDVVTVTLFNANVVGSPAVDVANGTLRVDVTKFT